MIITGKTNTVVTQAVGLMRSTGKYRTFSFVNVRASSFQYDSTWRKKIVMKENGNSVISQWSFSFMELEYDYGFKDFLYGT